MQPGKGRGCLWQQNGSPGARIGKRSGARGGGARPRGAEAPVERRRGDRRRLIGPTFEEILPTPGPIRRQRTPEPEKDRD